ncbi:MAG: serine hydrolase [Bacteroidales bacterium]|nr:beta-lactamase family protein [Bacteroidales bacterium]MDD3989510.1 serine hydrolase [Bacteroidales bacterium]
MKKTQLTLAPFLLFAIFIFISCEKGTTIDPNQLLIDQMKAATDSVIQTTRVPGIVALVVDHKRGIDWLYTSGKSDIENNLPMDGSYVFRIGSHTKTMTTTVLLQLVDEGKIALSDKLSKYYPNYPQADNITISMLLTMKSGIFSYSDDLPVFMQSMVTNPGRIWLPQELIDLGFSNDFYFEAGTNFHYSNTNTFIIGQLIEDLTGNSVETEINTRLIQPLQLSNTKFLTSGVNLPGNHGKGYEIAEPNIYTDVTEYYDISWGWAAGSAYSTPRELQKYVERLVGGGFLSYPLQQQRLTEDFYSHPDWWMGKISYGLGIMRCGSFYGHGGDLPGFSNCTYHSNEKDCTIIIYFNTQDDYPSALLFLRFLDILYGDDY